VTEPCIQERIAEGHVLGSREGESQARDLLTSTHWPTRHPKPKKTFRDKTKSAVANNLFWQQNAVSAIKWMENRKTYTNL